MEYAQNYNFMIIAEVKQKQILSTATICCGRRNLKFFEGIIDIVTQSQPEGFPQIDETSKIMYRS